jgi:glutamate synthase domain-containing protein 2
MGISAVQSYHGAQVFEAVACDRTSLTNFGTASRFGGVRMDCA